MPSVQAAPDFLQKTNYAMPNDMYRCPFQAAFDTDLSRFAWLKTKPELSANFGRWMSAQHDRHMTWLDVLDFRAEIAASNDSHSSEPSVTFVDVGGGVGHQCGLLKSKVSDLNGRVVLQDSPSVISQALATPGVETMSVDFFQEQPILGKNRLLTNY
jgi:demethylsterigmatocystin 6-O-methyltransferase